MAETIDHAKRGQSKFRHKGTMIVESKKYAHHTTLNTHNYSRNMISAQIVQNVYETFVSLKWTREPIFSRRFKISSHKMTYTFVSLSDMHMKIVNMLNYKFY